MSIWLFLSVLRIFSKTPLLPSSRSSLLFHEGRSGTYYPPSPDPLASDAPSHSRMYLLVPPLSTLHYLYAPTALDGSAISETPASPQISVVSFPLLVVYHPYGGYGTLAPCRLDQETTQAACQASPRFPSRPTAPTPVGDHVFGSPRPGRKIVTP